MQILITGVAGFIGFHLAKNLLKAKVKIVGIDSINSYYSTKLKKDRLKYLKKLDKKNIFKFKKIDISKKNDLTKLFNEYKFDQVVHLAAQAGVRYSLENPRAYLVNNIDAFFNILDCSRQFKVNHFIYASSSSVYGNSKKRKSSELDSTDKPIQFYAATKKSNEVMAHSYSEIYKMRTTGFRFFTAYGPWGRPDHALYKFTNNIIKKRPVHIFNYGKHTRDFTYVDDIVSGIMQIMFLKKNKITKLKKSNIFNLGGNKPVKLMKFLEIIEKNLKMKSIKKYFPLQQGDIIKTTASINYSKKILGYKPKTNLESGIKNFVIWFKDYYKK